MGLSVWYPVLRKQGRTAAPKGQERPVMYEIELVRGHVEVYLDGEFCFSADTRSEAEREIAEMTA